MSILRHEENGVEFFTVQTTGESGMSQSGLARMCGVTQKAIDNLLDRLSTSSCPNFLKPLQESNLTLGTSYHEYHNVTIIKDSVCAVILEWYAFESQRPTEKARQTFRQFAVMGIRTWIQSITGWQDAPTEIALNSQKSIAEVSELLALDDLDLSSLFQQLTSLRQDLNIALKHRHIIHNVVEKPVAVDLSLNRIVHTAIHEQAIKLNRAIATLEKIQQSAASFSRFNQAVQQNIQIDTNLREITSMVEQLRQENKYLKQVIEQQRVLISSRRKDIKPVPLTKADNLQQVLAPRIEEIVAILMKSQKRTGGNRAINTCTRKANIYARYEIGQSLNEIATSLQIPYETVKSYVKLTRADLRNY